MQNDMEPTFFSMERYRY